MPSHKLLPNDQLHDVKDIADAPDGTALFALGGASVFRGIVLEDISDYTTPEISISSTASTSYTSSQPIGSVSVPQRVVFSSSIITTDDFIIQDTGRVDIVNTGIYSLSASLCVSRASGTLDIDIYIAELIDDVVIGPVRVVSFPSTQASGCHTVNISRQQEFIAGQRYDIRVMKSVAEDAGLLSVVLPVTTGWPTDSASANLQIVRIV